MTKTLTNQVNTYIIFIDILKLMQKKPEPEDVIIPPVQPADENRLGGDKGMDEAADEIGSRRNKVRGWFKKKRTTVDKKREPKEDVPWRHVIMEEAELPATDFVPAGQDTVLLTAPEPEKKDKPAWLRSLDGEMEDISLTYYPFVIGKQKNLVDYVVDRETVSRLHVKIEKSGEHYIITDLNSTNGTSVNGVMLENNGSAYLSPGDEVQVSIFRYRFEA